MLYIYREKPSDGAKLLAEALTAAGVPSRKIREFTPARIRRAEAVICWGSNAPPGSLENGYGLNAVPVLDKFTELTKLSRQGVEVPEFGQDPIEGYLGRSASHFGGADLLNPPPHPAYWVKKEEIVKEYRIHIFRGQSIRAGRKEKFREDAHPWIRSHEAGWHLVYDGHGVKAKHREAAKAAVEALGLEFGAVDIGERPDGTVLVFEVNRAPGLEGNTVAAYATAIKQWYEEVTV